MSPESRQQLVLNLRWEINRIDGMDANPLNTAMNADRARARFATVFEQAGADEREMVDGCAEAMADASSTRDVLDLARILRDQLVSTGNDWREVE